MKQKPETSHSYGKAALVGLKAGWGRVSGDLQGRANSVSKVDGVSDMIPTCLFCGSVGESSEKVQCPLLTFLSGRKLSPDVTLMRHFSFSLYATAALQAVTLVLELRRSESE